MLKMPTRKNAVVAAVGDHSLHKHWVPTANCDYDLYLVNYGTRDYAADARVHVMRAGTKFHLIDDLLAECPRLGQYDRVWMPDDDLYATPREIGELFRVAEKYGLWLCQPSLVGWYGLEPTLHHRGCVLRYTNYVEIMCPCFSRAALAACRGTFKENSTGWGIDAAWNVLLGHPTERIAVIDDVIVAHTRPVGGGDMYKNQTRTMGDAMEEAANVYRKYNLAAENYKDLKSGRAVSQELFYTRYYSIVEYGRVFRSVEAGVDVSRRLWPPTDIMRDFCNNVRDQGEQASL
jgi:hypothetical protein